ncbi:hypothetical protein C8R45DRAFT_363062 [Mycena sanguinolenta]|nr:hypothetical protein C8R45DRAFT_363062 [Mycena sanguinolenta]
MFAIAIVLWTLDLANFIMEAKITLIESSGDAIGAKYHEALAFVFRLEAVEDILYAYMVRTSLLMFDSGLSTAFRRLYSETRSSYTASGDFRPSRVVSGRYSCLVRFSLALSSPL